MILNKISEHYDITTAERVSYEQIKQGKQNVRVQYNQRTDMFEVLYDVEIKESK